MKRHKESEHESHRERLKRYRASFRVPAPGPEYVLTGVATTRARIVVLVLAASLISGALYVLGKGGIAYRNYFGASIFIPFALVLGIVMFLAALFGWRRPGKRSAAHENASEPVLPGNDWHKW